MKCVRICCRGFTKDGNEAGKIKATFKVDIGDIPREEYAEADGPDGRDVPPVLQSVGHDPESASLTGKLGRVA